MPGSKHACNHRVLAHCSFVVQPVSCADVVLTYIYRYVVPQNQSWSMHDFWLHAGALSVICAECNADGIVCSVITSSWRHWLKTAIHRDSATSALYSVNEGLSHGIQSVSSTFRAHSYAPHLDSYSRHGLNSKQ